MAASIVHNGSKTVTTAGTPVALKTSGNANWITIQPLAANSAALIYIGSSTVTATSGVVLAVGDTLTMSASSVTNAYDLSTVFIDTDTNGAGVQFIYGAF